MLSEFSYRTRNHNINTLKTEPLDVLVIGGGVVGAGLIRDLMLNGGIKAGLIEKGDFASGTSGASSQLIHGGFRYIAKRDIALVKQSRKEREILHHIAPNLVKPLPLAILRYKGDPYPLAGIQLAARYYNHLSKSDEVEKSKLLRDVNQIHSLVGPVLSEGLKGCVILWDSTVDDSRLTLATLKDAHFHGAVVANYVQFEEYVSQPDNTSQMYFVKAKDSITGETFEIATRKIVSTTGPWTDQLWKKDPCYDGTSRLVSKDAQGIHLILPNCLGGDTSVKHGLILLTQTEKSYNSKQRGIFVLPGEHDTSIIGTTETTPESDPESARPTSDEVVYLLSEAQRVFPNMTLDNSSIIGSYAGVRPLIASNGSENVSDKQNFVSREHIITESSSGIIYVYGGKLTTHRLIAEETADYLVESLSMPRDCKTSVKPLPSAVSEDVDRKGEHINNVSNKALLGDVKERLMQRYGSQGYHAIEEFVSQDATLAEPVSSSLPFVKAEILYAYMGEMAITLDDILWRRTRIGWTRGQGLDLAQQIAQFIGERHEWNQSRISAEIDKYKRRIHWLNANL
ncbi:glycerol-3-phosphate dehydrogenase/oxidase [Candidatus Poribacteria bacterium]|nr:glycerol-3-phosphate dehydrogenase/oxidase [Candidatus Poribacteria bacterium]